MNKVLVIQYEQFFDVEEALDLREAIERGLETLREYGGARVVGSYHAADDEEFKAKALYSITINGPIVIECD